MKSHLRIKCHDIIFIWEQTWPAKYLKSNFPFCKRGIFCNQLCSEFKSHWDQFLGQVCYEPILLFLISEANMFTIIKNGSWKNHESQTDFLDRRTTTICAFQTKAEKEQFNCDCDRLTYCCIRLETTAWKVHMKLNSRLTRRKKIFLLQFSKTDNYRCAQWLWQQSVFWFWFQVNMAWSGLSTMDLIKNAL